MNSWLLRQADGANAIGRFSHLARAGWNGHELAGWSSRDGAVIPKCRGVDVAMTLKAANNAQIGRVTLMDSLKSLDLMREIQKLTIKGL